MDFNHFIIDMKKVREQELEAKVADFYPNHDFEEITKKVIDAIKDSPITGSRLLCVEDKVIDELLAGVFIPDYALWLSMKHKVKMERSPFKSCWVFDIEE